jgi:hydrogenase expression/formation protein HypC
MCLAIPGRIIGITGDQPMMRFAQVDFGGVGKQINLAYVPQAVVGDYVLVHVGFALTVIDEAEAERIFSDLEWIAGLRGTTETPA